MADATYRVPAKQHEFIIPFFSAYQVTLSDECAPGGDGYCDGFDYDEGFACECPCHTHVIPGSLAEIAFWHKRLHLGEISHFIDLED